MLDPDMPKKPTPKNPTTTSTKSPSDLAKVVGQIVALIEHLPTDEQKKVLDTVRVLTVGSVPVAVNPPRISLEELIRQPPPRPVPTLTYQAPGGNGRTA